MNKAKTKEKRDTVHPLLMELKRLGGVMDHDLPVAELRLSCLIRFWDAERKADYRDRCKVAQRVVKEIKAENRKASISRTSLFRWEQALRTHGVRGLLERRGRPSKYDGPQLLRVRPEVAGKFEDELITLGCWKLACCDGGDWFVRWPFAVGIDQVRDDKNTAAVAVWLLLMVGPSAVGAAAELFHNITHDCLYSGR